jgi:hypothetical protein
MDLRHVVSASIVALALALVVPSRADAHQSSVVQIDATVTGRSVAIVTRVAMEDMGDPLGRSVLMVPTRSQATAGRERAVRYVADRFVVSNAGARCLARPGDGFVRDRARDGGWEFIAAIRYECPRQIDDLSLRDELFFDLDPRAATLAAVHAFGATRELAFRNDAREARVHGQPSRLATFVDYLRLGVEHIFTGYDHLAFLLGLLLVAAERGPRRGLRDALAVVTAFTVAHSITLAAAGLGWVRIPSRLVECAIAASIVYVSFGNLQRGAPLHRWRVAFAFGLVHGFGFASVLGELGLPSQGLLLSLVGFNLGVEFGQLAVMSCVLPALMLVARTKRMRRIDAAGLAAIATAALVACGGTGLVAMSTALAIAVVAAIFAALARRVEYSLAVRVGGSVLLGALASLWLLERAIGHALMRGALG